MELLIRKFILPICLLTIVPVHLVQADLIVSQALSPSRVGEYSNYVDASSDNQQVADDFTLGQTTSLDSVVWYGRYNDAQTNPDPVDFTIRLFADDSGDPAASYLYEWSYTVNPTDTGSDYTGISWMRYDASLSALNLAAGTYWLSIMESDASTSASGNTQWLWADSDRGTRSTRSGDQDSWSTGLDVDHAFELYGSTIPLPSSVLLICSALPLLACRRRY